MKVLMHHRLRLDHCGPEFTIQYSAVARHFVSKNKTNAFAILLAAASAIWGSTNACAQTLEPLAGKIWGVTESRFVAFPEMLQSLTSKHYILLGERHGRHAHQGREAFIIGALAEHGRYPTIAFEMMDHTQDTAVAEYRQAAPEYALGLGLALNWANSNWPSWNYYQPVFDAAFTTKAQIVGADLSEAEQKELEAGSVTDELRDKPSFAYYKRQMTKAHCGLIEAPKAEKLARLQLARDTQMAEALKSQAHKNHGTLLIVGSSHIRKSRGISTHLPPEKTAVVFLRETSADSSEFLTPFQDIVEGDLKDFDYIWFTPKIGEMSLCDRIGKEEKE